MNEDLFFQQLFQRLPAAPAAVVVPPGDDCAALRLSSGKLLLLAVDQLVGGRHYHLHGPAMASPAAAGRKLLARNLSDIAAMGGTPLYCLLAMAVPPDRSTDWMTEYIDGILELAAAAGVHMIGGDLAGTGHDEVGSLTIVGEVNDDIICRRSGARATDVLLATGCFGQSLDSGHHLNFMPRCREGEWLARHGGHAMIDVSDGLLLDAWRLCQASQVGLTLELPTVPRRTRGTTMLQALTDGEDYELLTAVAADQAEAVLSAWPFPTVTLTRIGRFQAERPGVVCDHNGTELSNLACRGFDHLSRLVTPAGD